METIEEKAKTFSGDRRSFLRNAGVGAVAAAFILSCKKKKEDDPVPVPTTPTDNGVSLGTGDFRVLNYAYALEQLEAAFYTKVVTHANFTTIFSASEQTLLTDIAAHEVIHREFFRTALGTNAIPDLTLSATFNSINFGDKPTVLRTAQIFEDLGVSAYNGAGKFIVNTDYLVVAGKIVSVEARHASAIRDLLNPKSADFAGDDIVNKDSGLDITRTPSEVFAEAGKYIATKIDTSTLPS